MNTSGKSLRTAVGVRFAPTPLLPIRVTQLGRRVPIRDAIYASTHLGRQDDAVLTPHSADPLLPILLNAPRDEAPAGGHVPQGDHR
jgi:hypothetical protein